MIDLQKTRNVATNEVEDWVQEILIRFSSSN